ncbi:hypothetical protein [Marilutibacter chinensis]|uniref:Uncharacterized protein n=1 Tax=Marilutibacter chinensis TaxID=2912247 RepID=A0ABS9HXP3_9GAMM|nr:hypothetical protein [Lysobacter chinensis]MCF7223645.1 hypothetical protein [Lysobacter chinensis]
MNDIHEPESRARLREAHLRTEVTLSLIRRHAGGGLDPHLERQLDHHQRTLRGLLGREADLASTAIDAAKRALTAADPAAPLLMLEMAREALAAGVRRQLAGPGRKAA